MSGTPCGRRAWETSRLRSSSEGSDVVAGRADRLDVALVMDFVRPHSLLVRPALAGLDVAVEDRRVLRGRDVYPSAMSSDERKSSEIRVGDCESRRERVGIPS